MTRAFLGLLSMSLIVPSCSHKPSNILEQKGETDKEDPFASATATLLDFSFSGEVITDGFGYSADVSAQIKYTIGQLNGESSVGRLDRLQTSITDRVDIGGGYTKILYEAELPVAWGSITTPPRPTS